MIFARPPKPGLSEADFQAYWLHVHAAQYAQYIPQIRRYLIDFRVPVEGLPNELPYAGAAEIWLANAEEQLASLQSPMFLQGARADEPRWAAFWATFALDTTAQAMTIGRGYSADDKRIKLFVLLKRKPGMDLGQFRAESAGQHAERVKGLPGLRYYLQGHVVDGAYVIGETRFDAVEQWWFDDAEAVHGALASKHYQDSVAPHWQELVDLKYLFLWAGQGHWVIGPDFRGTA
jgi:hypothetical protein